MSRNYQLYTTAQVRELDRCAIDVHALPAILLMKRAAGAAFDRLKQQWPQVAVVHILCGSGNNGGDGYAMAALAAQRRLSVTVWAITENISATAALARDYARQEGVSIRPFVEEDWSTQLQQLRAPAVIVDALLGTGARLPLKPAYRAAIAAVNQAKLPVLAVDIPSGVNADTGAVVDIAIAATATVSIIGHKLGNWVGQGRVCAGQCWLEDLSLPAVVYQSLPPRAHVLHWALLRQYLPLRALDAHKGDCGHLLVVGGDHAYGGAVIMAAQMAARTGAGLVSVATQAVHCAAVIARQPELMAAGVASGQALLPLLSRPDVLVVGPGLGQSAWSEQLLYQCVQTDKPLVLDADALNLLAGGQVTLPVDTRCIMTPHPGEAARLLGISIAQVQADRIAAALALQQAFGAVIVLKGAGTIVVDERQQLWVCPLGNPGMASGGMGDVLSGLLGALVAQGLSLGQAAALGVYLHSAAADKAVEHWGQRSLLATDLIPVVATLLQTCESTEAINQRDN
ncbi:MAG: NAD(P)H-hydrate dehydratase [Cellvibrionaceae bacterium]|nr:NAD(P)H-hydrate dehydratase [Cellvibrionaceae bacterium]